MVSCSYHSDILMCDATGEAVMIWHLSGQSSDERPHRDPGALRARQAPITDLPLPYRYHTGSH